MLNVEEETLPMADTARVNHLLQEVAQASEAALAAGELDSVAAASLQQALEQLMRLYVAKVRQSADYVQQSFLSPLPASPTMTQTEAAVLIDQLLRQMGIELFELQLWRTFA
ncbi:MAG: hypothetical protein K6T31_03325 [Alicyclobacillus sp.]|nr:hypothetical protein [Alicyclobacillus sp.]